MSSTNIEQGDDKGDPNTEGQVSAPQNTEENTENTPTTIKAAISVKVNVAQEEPVAQSGSLSSLDELAERLKEQYKDHNFDKVVVLKPEEYSNNSEKPNDVQIDSPSEQQIITNYSIPSSSQSPKSLDKLDVVAIDIPEHVQVPISNSSVCTIVGIEDDKPQTNSIGSIKNLLQRERDRLEDEDSFVTVDGCVKEKTTSTEVPTIFSLDNRTQNVIMGRNNYYMDRPPPPYSQNPQYSQRQYTPVPVYQVEYDGRIRQQQPPTPTPPPPPPPQDTSRAPPYRRSSVYYANVEDLFHNKEIRNQFVRKVYMILSIQLLITFGFVVLAIYTKPIRNFITLYWPIQIVAWLVFIILLIVLMCYQATRRIYPLNFFLLSLLTISMAYFLAAMSCTHSTKIVMIALGSTALACTLISLLACQDWFDVTKWGMIICVATIIIIVYGFVAIIITITTGMKIFFLIYACLVTLLFSVYLMYDTQQILGGRRIEMSPEEYILGVLTLFVDIVIIFQYILIILTFFDR